MTFNSYSVVGGWTNTGGGAYPAESDYATVVATTAGELVIIRTDVADSGYWIILGGVLQMAAVSRWGAFASDPAPPMIAGPYRSLSAG